MGRGSVWERRVRLARRAEEADPQRSVTDKQRRQRALPSQTLPIFRQALGISGSVVGRMLRTEAVESVGAVMPEART
jgi:hypothetical protein